MLKTQPQERKAKMANRRKKNVRGRLSKVLEVPEEVSLQIPKLTILKFEEVLIENYKGILEYQDFFVRIPTSLEEMTTDDLIVKGKIESIDFESIEGNEGD